MAYKLKLLKQGFQNIGPYILSGLKFTRQNAGKCSSGYSSKQNLNCYNFMKITMKLSKLDISNL